MKKQQGLTLTEMTVAVAIIGIIAAVAWPAYERQSAKGRRTDQYRRFAVRVMDVDPSGKTDEEIIDEGVASFREFLQAIGVTTTLTEVGVGENDIEEIVNGVQRVSFGADGKLACNPPVSRDDLMDVLRKAL